MRKLVIYLFIFTNVLAFSIDRQIFISYDYSLFNINKFSIWKYKELLSPEENGAFIRFIPNLKFYNNVFGVNVEYDIRNYNSATLEHEFRELNFKCEYSNLKIFFGKTYTKFGTGYFYNPISVISKKKNLYDSDNKNLSQELVWLFKLDYFSDDFSISFVKFKKHNWNNYALLSYLYFSGFDLYSLLYYATKNRISYGFGFANTFGNALELHGEIIIKSDVEFNYHPIIFENNEEKTYESNIDFIKDRSDNEKEVMLGFNYTFLGYNIIGEYYHRDFGINKKQYLMLWRYVNYNYGKDSIFSPMNYYSVLDFLREIYLFKDYFFLRIAKNFNDFSFSIISLVNIEDKSLIYLADIGVPLKKNFTFYFKPIFFNGRKKSEFRNSLYSHILSFGFRFFI